MKKIPTFILGVVVFSLITGCTTLSTSQNNQSTLPSIAKKNLDTPTQEPEQQSTVDADVIKPFIDAKKMTIVSIKPYDSSMPVQNPVDDGDNSLINVAIAFQGQATLTGYVQAPSDMAEFFRDVCISQLDAYSTSQIPKFKGDNRELVVCFNDADAAKKMLGISANSGRKATVVIDNFVLNLVQGEGAEIDNQSKLVSVVK